MLTLKHKVSFVAMFVLAFCLFAAPKANAALAAECNDGFSVTVPNGANTGDFLAEACANHRLGNSADDCIPASDANACRTALRACAEQPEADRDACMQSVYTQHNIAAEGEGLDSPENTVEVAQCDDSGQCCEGDSLTSENCVIVNYILIITRVLSGLVGLVVVIMIAYGGIQYTIARDDPQAVAAAKNRIRNAIFALVFYLFSMAFLQWLIPGGLF